MKGKRKRLTEKELKQLQRVRAEEQEQARIESERRQARIEELSGLITSGKLMPGDEAEETARDLHSEIAEEVFGKWETVSVKHGGSEKRFLQRARQGTHQRRSPDELVRSLTELVALQRDEISYMRSDYRLYQWAKTHAPDEVAAIQEKYHRVVRAVLERANKLTPTQASERRTRNRPRDDEIGLIEYEFGGHAQARAFRRYDPICLDGIFMGYGVTMESLEILFGMERHRFPKGLSSVRDGRKIWYSAFAVVKIMDALLGEKLLEPKPQARGGSERKLWPSEPDSRKRVLMGIANRALAHSRYENILTAFMAVVCRHLESLCPNEQLPEGWEELARLGGHFLG